MDKTTEFIATVRIEGHLEGEYSSEEIKAIIMERVVTYFPDDSPLLEGSLGITDIDYIKS